MTGWGRPHNPFATRSVRPGAIPYRCAQGESLCGLMDFLRRSHWWGQIVGDHGSGKSTLLASLIPEIHRYGRQVIVYRLNASDRRPWLREIWEARWSSNTQVVVDGFSQLYRWERFFLQQTVRRTKAGLLVTSHRSLGLPCLTKTQTDLATVLEIVAELVGQNPHLISRNDVAASMLAKGNNVREILFDLYNLYELRQRHIRTPRSDIALGSLAIAKTVT